MAKEESEEISASGDTIILAEAIGHVGEGLFAIARAIERLADVQEGVEETQQLTTYLDDTRI